MKKTIYTLLFATILLTTSCTTEAPEYPFAIRVINDDGRALANVFVTATADVPNALPDFRGITDENGYVRFTYEYEAVLKVRAVRGSNPPSWMGCNFVKLEANKEVEISIVIIPFDPNQPGC